MRDVKNISEKKISLAFVVRRPLTQSSVPIFGQRFKPNAPREVFSSSLPSEAMTIGRVSANLFRVAARSPVTIVARALCILSGDNVLEIGQLAPAS